MAERVPQSTTLEVMFMAYLASDHVTPATGKTIPITISKAHGALANPHAGATNATAISNGCYYVALDTTDTGTLGNLWVHGAEATIDDVNVFYRVVSATNGGFDNSAVIASAVWNLVLTSYNAANSAAVYLKKGGGGSSVVLFSGNAASGAANSVTLGTWAPATANLLNGDLVVIVGGLGVGQTRSIIGYSAGRVAMVNSPWITTPNNTSVINILSSTGSPFSDEGQVVAATATTIQLQTTAPSGDGALVGSLVTITAGTDAGDTQVITAYTGATRTATVAGWAVTPDTTSFYAVIPTNDNAPSAAAPSVAQITAGVWGQAVPGSYAAGTAGNILGGYVAPDNADIATIKSDIETASTGLADRVASIQADLETAVTGLIAVVADVRGDVDNVETLVTALPAASAIADAILLRDWTAVVGAVPARSLLNAARFLRNKWLIDAGDVLHVKKEDDTTDAWTSSLTVEVSGNPFSGSAPTT